MAFELGLEAEVEFRQWQTGRKVTGTTGSPTHSGEYPRSSVWDAKSPGAGVVWGEGVGQWEMKLQRYFGAMPWRP